MIEKEYLLQFLEIYKFKLCAKKLLQLCIYYYLKCKVVEDENMERYVYKISKFFLQYLI